MKNLDHKPSQCEWINIRRIPVLNKQRIVIFGAGKGAEEYIEYSKKTSPYIRLVAIIDNDKTLWGKDLHGIPVASPSTLSLVEYDLIVVTSISGEQAIAHQLEAEGYTYNDDYVLIGRYPDTWITCMHKLKRALNNWSYLEGKTCLNVGPGGFLGLEVLMYCFGAEVVHAIDKFSFGIHYPEVTDRFEDYTAIKNSFELFETDMEIIKRAERRFDELFIHQNDKVIINSQKVSYNYPIDLCDIPIPDNSYDIILSFAVLEHVKNPGQAVNEIYRVLKDDGISFNTIITADHRSYSGFNEFNEFSFRSYSESEWESISYRKFFQNRVLPVEWKRLFEKSGFTFLNYSVDRVIDINDDMLNLFSNEFNPFSRKELGEVDCDVLLRKN